MNHGPKAEGYLPREWVDNLYLNWPRQRHDREKQTFFWLRPPGDHTVPTSTRAWSASTPSTIPRTGWTWVTRPKACACPASARTTRRQLDVEYDIPLAIYDLRLDDGVTLHQDIHDGMGEFPALGTRHTQVVGQTFFKHFPNHGFVGDIFTVNGTANPVPR